MTKTKTTVVSQSEMEDLEFSPPSSWYIIDCMGDAVFIHKRNRSDAIQFVKEEYNGRYTVRAARTQKSKGELSCTGTATRKK